MSLESRIIAFAQAVGGDVKALTTAQGSLTSLGTTNKTNLVAAINELLTLIGSAGASIDDAAGDDEMRARNPVPQQVTMRQARLELLKRELLDDVEAVITAAGREAQIQWEYAAVVERSNPAVAIVQQQKALTDAQIDDLFREAAKL